MPPSAVASVCNYRLALSSVRMLESTPYTTLVPHRPDDSSGSQRATKNMKRLKEPDRQKVRLESERLWRKRRQEILLDLANLDDELCERFRKRFPMLDVSATKHDTAILNLRDQLRSLWRKEDRLGAALRSWVHSLSGSQTWTVGTWKDGTHSIEPRCECLPLCLAIGVSEWGPKMAICENPDCPERYFLKGRKTQRFCDRRPCAAYGQRQHKLDWWNAHKDIVRPPKNWRRGR